MWDTRFIAGAAQAFFLPLLGAVVVFVLPRNRPNSKQLARAVALGFSLAVLALCIKAFSDYQSGACPVTQASGVTANGVQYSSPFAFACEHTDEYFPLLGSKWHVGIDGISATMLLLTGILFLLTRGGRFEYE